VLGAFYPDAVGSQQFFVLVDFGSDEGEKLFDVLFEALIGLVLTAPDPEGVGGETGTAIFFENLENLFPIAEGVEERRHGSNVERVGAEPKLVAGNAIELGEDDANVVSAWRRLDIQELLDGLTIAQPVGDRGNVVHAVDVWVEHSVGAVLGN